jgi:hypothetical protein
VTTFRDTVSADVAGLYDTGTTFAETVTGPDGEFPAVFSAEFREMGAGGYVVAMGSEPLLRTQDADAQVKGSAITVRGVRYRVTEVRPDGYGETVHRLQAIQ